MRNLTVGLHQQSTEAAQALRQSLTIELGTVVKTDLPPEVQARFTERDEVGFAELKAMVSQ